MPSARAETPSDARKTKGVGRPRKALPPSQPIRKPAPKPRAGLRVHVLAPPDGKTAEPMRVPYVRANPCLQGQPANDLSALRTLANEEIARGTSLWGVVPASFQSLTGLNAKALTQAVAQVPGCDLYLTNPSPHNEALFLNPWHQGYTAHPGFAEACSAVLGAAGLDIAALDALEPSATFAAGQGFFGNARFWSGFLDEAEVIFREARRTAEPTVLETLDSRQADPRNLHPGATYWHLIAERLVPLFLRRAGSGLQVHKIASPFQEAKMNAHLKRLREMKDVAHRTRSAWMYSCWLHYRNLYLLQVAGKKWCETHLPIISKSEVHFA